MTDNAVQRKESFEHFQESIIFNDDDYFLHHKYYDDECHEVESTFQQATCRPQHERLHLHQQADETANAEIARSMAIECGANVVSMRFSSFAITDRLVEGILPHLTALRYLQFDGAVEVGSIACRAIALFCHKSLRSLRISGRHLITSESCGWLAGIIGHNSPCLSKLRALDISSSFKVDDRGLAYLCKGIGQLEYLDLSHCPLLTFTGNGILDSLRHGAFGSMEVLSLHGCGCIRDEGVAAIARAMPNLKHLNLGGCVRITNKSAAAIGRNCTRLRTLSLEGAVGVTDAGLGKVCDHTNLDLLNITGCSISRKSLLVVIRALGYVQESLGFFGFAIRSQEARDKTLSERNISNANGQYNQAAHVIQVGWKSKRHTIHQIQTADHRKEKKAAARIQTGFLNSKSRKRFHELANSHLRFVASVRIQSSVRRWLAKKHFEGLVSLVSILTANATFVQKMYRGKFVRSRDTLVMPAILALRASRSFERRTLASTLIQCLARRVFAKKELGLHRRNHFRRRYFSTIVQCVGRSMLARRRARRLTLCTEVSVYYCNKMVTRIQCFLRKYYFARRELNRRLTLAAERYLLEHRSMIKIQSFLRGRWVSQKVRMKRIASNNAAVEIQKIYRRHRVPKWQQTKHMKLSQSIRERADGEHTLSLEARDRHAQSPYTALTDGVDEGSLGNMPNDSEMLKYVFGESFVGLRTLVYWPGFGLYKKGRIECYNDRMRLWKIDYDADDNEWLDLVREQDRIMVKDDNAINWLPYVYCRPQSMTQYMERRKSVEPANSTWTQQESQEKITSDSLYCAYVARGLLDECYQTQSTESVERLRQAHLVKALTVSIAKVKHGIKETMQGSNEIEHLESLLSEVEWFIRMDLAKR